MQGRQQKKSWHLDWATLLRWSFRKFHCWNQDIKISWTVFFTTSPEPLTDVDQKIAACRVEPCGRKTPPRPSRKLVNRAEQKPNFWAFSGLEALVSPFCASSSPQRTVLKDFSIPGMPKGAMSEDAQVYPRIKEVWHTAGMYKPWRKSNFLPLNVCVEPHEVLL